MIGICIRYAHENYGGMLQAFATTKLLEERGLDYELIRYQKKKSIPFVIRSMPRLLNRVLLNDKVEALKKSLGKLQHPEFAEQDALRLEAFRNFNQKKFTKLSPVFFGYKELCAQSKRYQAVITGSDQLWSPAGLPTNFYNLNFVNKDVRRISYASSFGVSNIPWYQRKRTADFLNRLDYISMREIRGSEIVEELTGKKVPTVLDPVFMLDAQKWDTLIPSRRLVQYDYIFAYFLGSDPTSRKAVQELARMTGLKIVALRHLDQYVAQDESFGDYAPYDVGPEEFLNYIRYASYVCTDSFHGTCFSLIYKKKFVIFNRYSETSKTSKNSRISTLCAEFSVEDRRYNDDVSIALQEIDYDFVFSRLGKMKEVASRYLDEALMDIH